MRSSLFLIVAAAAGLAYARARPDETTECKDAAFVTP